MSQTNHETRIERAFFRECGAVPKTLAYIPSQTDPSRKYFAKIENHFRNIGTEMIFYCDLDREFRPEIRQTIERADAVYLAGGSTPYFLMTLHSRSVIPSLRDQAKTKPMIGVSAGALVCGPDLSILFDDPEEGKAARVLTDSKGLQLYGFDFWPHFGRTPGDEDRLKKRSTQRTVIACDDSSGLILRDDRAVAVGTAHLFLHGQEKTFRDEILKP